MPRLPLTRMIHACVCVGWCVMDGLRDSTDESMWQHDQNCVLLVLTQSGHSPRHDLHMLGMIME